MLDLMAVSRDENSMPLYLQVVQRVLRDMRMIQQEEGSTFDYSEFKRQLEDTTMTPAQLAPLAQRLDTLESFMPLSQRGNIKSGVKNNLSSKKQKKGKGKEKEGGKTKIIEDGIDWSSEVCSSRLLFNSKILTDQAGYSYNC